MTCAKQLTMAVIVSGLNYYVGSNWCKTPQIECPRKDMPSGVGYKLCQTICHQPNHAEIDACINAGIMAKGATLYLIGHTYCCDNCKKIMKRYGIKNIIIKESV